ncbi:hypothetical protein CRE_23655 [Caenorhabditis remanei]|uniref:Uncharacterized protein n=1 Tax=Caenorhabditis remanei TaxID=31234 RepID=E3N4B4_CAERE|nr:hypothetical protein CRE_23655 [Caenorhabditis remanei]
MHGTEDSKKGKGDADGLWADGKKNWSLIIPSCQLCKRSTRQTRRGQEEKRPRTENWCFNQFNVKIDEEMERFMMEGNEDENDKENLVIQNDAYQVSITHKVHKMDLSNGEGPRDKNRTMNLSTGFVIFPGLFIRSSPIFFRSSGRAFILLHVFPIFLTASMVSYVFSFFPCLIVFKPNAEFWCIRIIQLFYVTPFFRDKSFRVQ